MTMRLRRQAGSTMLEFVLIGIAVIFMLICLFEISRGLWAYHTLAYAVREGTRYAAMHGRDCASPNTCTVTIGNIVTQMKYAGGGFDPDNTTLTFTPQTGSATSDTITGLLASSTESGTYFPPSGAYAQGNTVQIAAKYKFKTILAMLWFGGKAINDDGTFYLTASSSELIQF
jgi:Flp pilus assembly protein TadG